MLISKILVAKKTYTWGAQDNNTDIYQEENLMAEWFVDDKILISYSYFGQYINFYILWPNKICLSDQFY